MMRSAVVQLRGSSAALLMFMMASSLSADVVISIQSVNVVRGNTALVGVFVASDTADVIAGFNLPMDFNSDGYQLALPTGFTLNATPVQNALYANTALDTVSAMSANVDWIPTGTGVDVTLGSDLSTRTKLFDLAIDVDSGVASGTVAPIEIRIPATPFESLFLVDGPSSPTVAAPSTGAPVFGAISVVPEPGSFWLILVVSSMCALWQGVRSWRGAANA